MGFEHNLMKCYIGSGLLLEGRSPPKPIIESRNQFMVSNIDNQCRLFKLNSDSFNYKLIKSRKTCLKVLKKKTQCDIQRIQV